MERIESDAIVCVLARAGELVVGAVWDDPKCEISLRQCSQGQYVLVAALPSDPDYAFILDEGIRDYDALDEWVEALCNFDQLPRIVGDTDAAEWCRRVVRDAAEYASRGDGYDAVADFYEEWSDGLRIDDSHAWASDFVGKCAMTMK